MPNRKERKREPERNKVINKLNRYFDVHYIEDFVPDEKVLFVNRKKDI